MDLEKASGKGNVKLSIAEPKQQLPANPQLYPYFLFLYVAAYCLTLMITIGPSVSHKDSAFNGHGVIFKIIAIVSLSLVVVASGFLIFTSHYLNMWMKEIHYAILKTVGSFSTINGLFSFAAVFLVPKDLNWNVYVIMSFIFVCIIMPSYYLLWRYVCTEQLNKLCNTFPLHWSAFLTPLVPLSISLRPFIPPVMWYAVTWGSFFVVVKAGYFSFIKEALEPLLK